MQMSLSLSPKTWFPTIRTKMIAIVSLLIGLISLFIYIFFPSQQENQAIKAISAKAQGIARMTAFSIAPGLFFEDMETVDEVLKSARQNRDLVYMVVMDSHGQVTADFNGDKAGSTDQVKDGSCISADGNTCMATTAILLNGQEIGRLYLGLSLAELKAGVDRSRTTVALVSLMVFTLGIMALSIIGMLITSHLDKVVETVEQISSGDLTKRAAVSSQDEVGYLARAFNQMVDNLQSACDELEKVNRELEKRVGERTRELRYEVERRKRTNEELNLFLHTISHDLKNPMVSIQGFSSLLAENCKDCLDDNAKMYVQRIQKNTDQMETLIADLIEISNVSGAGKQVQLVDMRDVISNVVKASMPQLKERGIRLIVQDDIPSVHIYCDRRRMEQIFAHLIDNASKFMGPNSKVPTIEVGYEDQDDFHGFYVRDNGIGIAEEYHEKIFQGFQRLNDIQAEGTGVGLAIMKRIVENLGGKIWVDSAKGSGTTMHFTIPKNANAHTA